MPTQGRQWTQLPDPRARRDEYDDYTYYDLSDDYSRSVPLDAQPPRWSRSNRASIQTSNTDALTESTFSPHSPTASSIVGATRGLAPRPPSYQHPVFSTTFAHAHAHAHAPAGVGVGAPVAAVSAAPFSSSLSSPFDEVSFPQEAVFNSPRDMSRRQNYSSAEQNQEQAFESTATTIPAAPDTPLVPPASHRQPHAHQPTLPYEHPRFSTGYIPQPARQFQSMHSPRCTEDQEMNPEANYTTRREENPDITRQYVHDVIQRQGIVAPHTLPEDVAMASQQRQLRNGQPERHKKFANDRSPLQRLELTLDSLTKEEKRARVQAAEQRARERAARRAAEASANQAGGVHNRNISSECQAHAPTSIAQFSPPHTYTSPPRQSDPREQPYQQHQAQHHLRPQQVVHQTNVSNIASPPALLRHEDDESELHQPRSDLPERNLSFRERTAPSEQEPRTNDQAYTDQPKAFFTGGNTNVLSMAGTGSDRPRNEVPHDLKNPQRAQSNRENPAPGVSRLPATRQPHANAIAKDKELPPIPAPHQAREGIPRRATEPVHERDFGLDEQQVPHGMHDKALRAPSRNPELGSGDVATARRRLERQESNHSIESAPQHRVSRMIFKDPEELRPGEGLYKSPVWLDEYEKATVGSLCGSLLDLTERQPSVADKGKAWWETGSQGKNTPYSSRPCKAGAFDGEYDDTDAPTRFKPPLYLKCGPLLKYSGIRHERLPIRGPTNTAAPDREFWRGSVMIVTRDAESSYDIAPMLRLFVQDIGLLPPPPQQIHGDLPAEYVDPIAGHPKLGRRGETLYVRPVEHLEEAKDLSQIETDKGLFERFRSPTDMPVKNGEAELPQSFAGRQRRISTDGEKMQRFKDVRGFRLHAERGCTFWRFNIEVELQEKQQRIAYRINRGPCMAFWVPARAHAMNMMFHSCNGFSASVNPDDLSGPDPMWRDVLNNHQSQPFHVMIGGGDQIYNDSVAQKCELFDEWLDIRNPEHKHGAAFTVEMQNEMEEFYLGRYCMWFSRGLFALAASQIPMVNMYDDHDIFDGYGSYPDHYMKSPVFAGLGAVAFKYYMLFQQQTVVTETENKEPSWILGVEPGPYIKELSRSIYVSMGGKVALLAVDCRTERSETEVVKPETWEKITNRLYAEVRRGQVEHLLVVMGVPIAYPRLVWLENILTSRLMNPVKALGRTGLLGKALNNIDGGVEVLDDLNDHWTAKNHKQERSIVIEDLQDLAIDKSLRVTLLSGDVHLAAIGQFYSKTKLGVAKHKDPRYMVNVISSAIANAPPSNMLADALNKRNKVHHFDSKTDESMVPLFQHGVEGKPRNNKHLLPHRNWCSIRTWSPGMTPPPTPPLSAYDRSPSPPSAMISKSGRRGSVSGTGGAGGLFRRLSLGGRGGRGGGGREGPDTGAVLGAGTGLGEQSTWSRFDGSRTSARGSKPPVSGGMGGLFRSLSRRNSTNAPRPVQLARTLSLGSVGSKRRGIFSLGQRRNTTKPDDGGINGQWGEDSEEGEDDYFATRHQQYGMSPSGLRGGGGYDSHNEFSEDDEAHFTARPSSQRAPTLGSQPARMDRNDAEEEATMRRRAFHRTPTGLSVKQMRKADEFQVDLEGGLDICLNVEVNAKDPTGITVPYRLLVPRLQYEYNPAEDELQQPIQSKVQQATGIKRLLSFRKKSEAPKPSLRQQEGNHEETDGDEDYPSDASSDMAPRR
ncbi:hypothetical protein E4U42_005917 [Claviceps africana]|uniref:PhoD-like phosphatase domain-containing protein n=1 Tax=Claviceps africana TaxID=83212 RepID=A0A8K0J955_9HYPO|nr:hypothetical protein E4U42_005917 [Claviceps africana]